LAEVRAKSGFLLSQEWQKEKGLIEPNMGAMVPNMGTKRTDQTPSKNATASTGFGSALFTETQQRLLRYLFGQPQRSFYGKELIKLTASGSGAIQRELKRLETSGLITAHWQGNQKHYQANAEAPIYTELCNIAEKTFGLADPIRECLEPFADEIHAAFIYGSVAKQSEHALSDIDVMVISDTLSYAQLMGALEPAAQRLGRQINPTLYTSAEFQQRQTQNNSFLMRILQQNKIWLIGKGSDLSA
jgi:predicted nucleotidyltransferase/predicted transcriptional regulator